MSPRVRVPPQDPPSYEIGITPDEAERLAAGDIVLLDDPLFNGYKWSIWRRRLAEEIARDPDGGEWERVTVKTGPLDEEWTQANLGGGTFDLRGYFDSGDGNGKNMKRRVLVTIAGPRKNFAAAPPTPAALVVPNGAGLSRSERILIKMLRAMDQRLERIERAPAVPTAPTAPPPTMREMVETMVALETLRSKTGPAAPQTDSQFLQLAMDTLRQGIEIGQSRDPAPAGDGGTDWSKVAEMALPVIDRMIAHRQGRRVPPRAPSGAEVVSSTPTAPAPPAPPDPETPRVSHRWVTAIESLARAVLLGEDPVEWAYWLQSTLEPSEFGLLRLGDVDRVMTDVRAVAGTREELAILHTDHAREFVAAVLDEIKNPTAEDEPESPSGS